jgi:hypothetical protein
MHINLQAIAEDRDRDLEARRQVVASAGGVSIWVARALPVLSGACAPNRVARAVEAEGLEVLEEAERRAKACASCPTHPAACAGEPKSGLRPEVTDEGLAYRPCPKYQAAVLARALERSGVGRRFALDRLGEVGALRHHPVGRYAQATAAGATEPMTLLGGQTAPLTETAVHVLTEFRRRRPRATLCYGHAVRDRQAVSDHYHGRGEHPWQRMGGAALVALDGLAPRMPDAVRGAVGHVIRTRYDAARPTIVTIAMRSERANQETVRYTRDQVNEAVDKIAESLEVPRAALGPWEAIR